jgi:hypothetical protein
LKAYQSVAPTALEVLCLANPALTGGAKVCRASGAECKLIRSSQQESGTGEEIKNATRKRKWRPSPPLWNIKLPGKRILQRVGKVQGKLAGCAVWVIFFAARYSSFQFF